MLELPVASASAHMIPAVPLHYADGVSDLPDHASSASGAHALEGALYPLVGGEAFFTLDGEGLAGFHR